VCDYICIRFYNFIKDCSMEASQMGTRTLVNDGRKSEGRIMPVEQFIGYSRIFPGIVRTVTHTAHHRITQLLGLLVLLLVVA